MTSGFGRLPDRQRPQLSPFRSGLELLRDLLGLLSETKPASGAEATVRRRPVSALVSASRLSCKSRLRLPPWSQQPIM